MTKLRSWKKKSAEKKIIKSVLKGDKIVIDGQQRIVLDVGNNYIVVRDENYNTFQVER